MCTEGVVFCLLRFLILSVFALVLIPHSSPKSHCIYTYSFSLSPTFPGDSGSTPEDLPTPRDQILHRPLQIWSHSSRHIQSHSTSQWRLHSQELQVSLLEGNVSGLNLEMLLKKIELNNRPSARMQLSFNYLLSQPPNMVSTILQFL